MTTTPDQYLLRTYNWTGLGDTGVTTALPSGALTPSSGVYTISYAFLETLSEAEAADYTASSSFSYAANYEYSHFDSVNSVQEGAALVSMGLYSEVAPLSFTVGTYSSVMLTFGQINDTSSPGFYGLGNGASALTYNYSSPASGSGESSDDSVYGNTWYNADFSSSLTSGWSSADPGSYQFHSVLHELGHALGLKHPDDTSGAGADPNSADITEKYTVMFDTPQGWTATPTGPTPYAAGTDAMYNGSSTTPLWAYGLQINDIAAIQDIYGRDYSTRSSNTLYDFGNGLGRDADPSKAFIYAIWDGGGSNVIDTTGFSGPVMVDLRQGAFSSIGSNGNGANGYDPGVGREIDNVSIAYHTVIQSVIAPQANSVVIGNAWDDVLYASGNNAKIYSDGIAYNNDAGFITGVPGDTSDPNNSTPSIQNDILIGGLGNTTFYSGLGSNVIVAFYDKSVIDSATSGWSTYWDAAGQFTGSHNATGSALADIDPGATYYAKTADYSQLNAAENVALAGGALHIEVTVTSSYITVDKDTASSSLGTDYLNGINGIVGTEGSDTFSGTSDAQVIYYASKGDDTYGVSNAALDYSPLDLLSTHAHIIVTASSSGVVIDKADDNGSLGEDTASTTANSIQGTSGDDSFSGFVPGETNLYQESAGNNTYSFDMATFGTGPADTSNISIYEGAGGSLNNISVANYDGAVLNSHPIGAWIEFDYYAWNSATSEYDNLTIAFTKTVSGPDVETLAVGSTTYEFGGAYSDIITGASGVHIIDGGGGTNTIDYSAATGGITANLSTGAVSDNGWGYTDTLSNVSIIIGSHHDDSITGDGTTTTVSYADATGDVAVDLAGGTATGDGSDTLSAVPNVIGSSYDDTITSSSADNIIDGGAGTNTVSYAAASTGVTVDLSAGTATGDGNDTLINIQNVIGSSHDDILSGASGVDNILDGGSGTNTVDYSHDVTGVTVDLSAGMATDGSGGTDTLANIQNVTGSAYDDVIVSSSGDNVIDGGTGTNTVSYEAAASGVTVDLHGGTATGDGSDTLSNIQNVTGSSHDDIIISNSADNIIDGGGGNDTVSYLYASSAVTVDLSAGTATGDGNDTLIAIHNVIGSSHNDVITGDGNDNIIAGGAGNDVIDGAGGANTIDYSYDPAGVTVDLSTGTATDGWSGSDTFSNIQNVIGSAYDDTITGDSHDNIIAGGAGNDLIDGGGGVNTVDYSHDPAAVTVDLSMGTATDAWSDTDTLSNIQNVIGSAYDDTITGDSHDNIIVGGQGYDVIDGGGGINTIDYSHDPAAVTVILSSGSAYDGWGDNDTLSNIQNVIGSAYDDYIVGDSNDNVIVGGAGNDFIDGDGGTNTIDYSHDPAGVFVDLYNFTATDGWGDTDTFYNIQNVTGSAFNDVINAYGTGVLDGGGGTNTVEFLNWSGVTVDLSMSTATEIGIGTETLYNFQNVVGSSWDDVITGDSQDNVIVGGEGNDAIDGGGGTNTVDYSGDPGSVFVDLSSGYAYDGWGDMDTLTNIQNIVGSAYDDYMIGNSNNVFVGGAGNDYIDGGSGTNTVDYSHDPAGVTVDLYAGTANDGYGDTDTLVNIQNVIGSAFDDVIVSSSADNVIDGGAGNNTVSYEYAASGVTVDLHAGSATGDGSDTLANIQNMIGSSYDDTIILNSGNHVIDGGGGVNTLSYAYASAGVTVDLSAGTATGDGSDTISNIQNVTGSDHNDILAGVSGVDNILDGGGGINTVDYSHDVAGVTVLLTYGVASDGGGGTDSLANIQNVVGSAFDDNIQGDGNDNVIVGGAGNDAIDGGGGMNTVDYSHDPAGVTVDLSLGYAYDGWGGLDSLSNIQTVIGSHYDDSLTGDGTSTVSYETALNGVTVDLSAGTASGDGNDTLSGIANVTGSSHDDTITGDSNDNILYGNGGNDYLTGGAGADTFLLKGATAETGVTTIADFNTGDGDKIDISNVISTYDSMTMLISNFVQLSTSGSDTQLKVDTDGTGTSYHQIALIQGVTGLDLATLIGDHNLIVPA